MNPSKKWIEHFSFSALQQRINWQLTPSLSPTEKKTILRSMQAWQLGETSDGAHLIHVASEYARKHNDPYYVDAVKLFIKEEQKHGEQLGRYLDALGEKRLQKDWGDTLFRKARYFNTSMEIWTITVLIVESAAQVYYQSLKDATGCALLKQLCTDILIDEAYHIRFQTERLSLLFNRKSPASKVFSTLSYRAFFVFTSCLIWFAHRKVLKAGGNTFMGFMRKMRYKYVKTFHRSLSVDVSTVTYQAFFHPGN